MKKIKMKRTIGIGQQDKYQYTEFRDLVPPKYRNLLPKTEDILEKYSLRSEYSKLEKKISTYMTRRKIPLGLTKDNTIEAFNRHGYKCRGLNQEKFNALIGAKRIGLTDKLACNLAGIHPDTLVTWLKKGEKDVNSPHHLLYLAYHEVKAELIAEYMDSVRQAGTIDQSYNEVLIERNKDTGQLQLQRIQNKTKTKDWRASAWALERLVPEFKPNYNEDKDPEDQNVMEDLFAIDALTMGMTERLNMD